MKLEHFGLREAPHHVSSRSIQSGIDAGQDTR